MAGGPGTEFLLANIFSPRTMGYRLAVGRVVLAHVAEVRILLPQPNRRPLRAVAGILPRSTALRRPRRIGKRASQPGRAARTMSRAVFRVELLAIRAECPHLAVGSAKARLRNEFLAAPDFHVLEDVLGLLGGHEPVKQRGARFRRQEFQSMNQRLGLRSSRTWQASDISMNSPSTGVARIQIRMSIPMERSCTSTSEYPNP